MKNKIKAKYCPKCKDEKMVELKNGEIVVFECQNCKFREDKK
jgi:hypothetical protein